MIAPTWLPAQSRFYLLASLASLLLFSMVLHLSATSQLAAVPLNGYTLSSKSGDHSPFEIEGLALGAKFASQSELPSQTDHVAWLLDSLRERFQQTIFPERDNSPGYPVCTLNLRANCWLSLEQQGRKCPNAFVLSSCCSRTQNMVSLRVPRSDYGSLEALKLCALCVH